MNIFRNLKNAKALLMFLMVFSKIAFHYFSLFFKKKRKLFPEFKLMFQSSFDRNK
jgi:hypothetical protein